MNINEFKTEWITNGIDESTVNFAEKFGSYLTTNSGPDKDSRGNPVKVAPLTSSQIRNVFGEVKRIQAKGYDGEKPAFLLLRPKIAYAEARVKAKSSKSRIEDFRKVMERAHIVVKTETHFQNFVDFLEATLAYHKAAGGRD